MLLQDAMSGSATTIFIACVVNEEADAEETYATLSFASRVRCVKNVQFTRGEMSLAGGGGGAASSRALAAAATLTHGEPDEITPQMEERLPPPSQKQHVLARRALNPILTNCTVNAIAQQALSAAQPVAMKQPVVESAPPPPTVVAAAPRARRSAYKPQLPNVVAAVPAAPAATVESSNTSSRTASAVSFVPQQAHAPQESAAVVAARQRTAAVLKRVAFDTDPRTVSVPTTRMSLLQPQQHAGEILAPPEDSALAPAAQGSMSEAARLKSLLATRKRSPGRASGAVVKL